MITPKNDLLKRVSRFVDGDVEAMTSCLRYPVLVFHGRYRAVAETPAKAASQFQDYSRVLLELGIARTDTEVSELPEGPGRRRLNLVNRHWGAGGSEIGKTRATLYLEREGAEWKVAMGNYTQVVSPRVAALFATHHRD